MSHNITKRDGLFVVRQPAWHGLVEPMPDYLILTVEEADRLFEALVLYTEGESRAEYPALEAVMRRLEGPWHRVLPYLRAATE